MAPVTVQRIRLELGKLNLRLHPASRYRAQELDALADMMLEDISPHRISDEEFCAVVLRWRVTNNFVPTSKDVLETLTIVRKDMTSRNQLALPVTPERKDEVFSEEYCRTAVDQIGSILAKVNKASPTKQMARQYGGRV